MRRFKQTDMLYPLLGVMLFLLLWQAAATWLVAREWILPSPLAVARAFAANMPLLLRHSLYTLGEAAAGMALAVLLAMIIAWLLSLSQAMRKAIYPLLLASQMVPIIVLAPLFIIWFGYGLLPKVVVVWLVCFFPIAINTADGLNGADPDATALLRSMGATRWQIFRKQRLPGALPAFFTGLKIAVTYSVVGAIIGEWVGASQGLGVFMLRASNAFLTARVFAAIAVTSLLSVALFLLVAALERLAIPWYFAAAKREQWEEIK